MLTMLPFGISVEAAITDWQKGATIAPESNTDFDSEAFRQSLRDLQATGATHVGLVVPYYQSNTSSADIHDGWNTPTDQALIAAIDYAHSLGLAVMLKPHIESYSGHWRAHIDPNDRNAWFSAYGDRIVHLAEIAEAHGVEYLLIGTELVSLTVPSIDSSNTQHWRDLIGQVRAAYSGAISYNANSTNYNPGNNDPFQDEKRFIEFWDALDFVGLSVYYGLNTGESISELRDAWDMINDNDLRPFQQQVNKPLVFTEIGYRSLDGARYAPWDWGRSGNPDLEEQANLYAALMSYWNDYAYMQGVYWWDWEPYPNAGGAGTTSYTPQNKTAETIMTDYFTSPEPPSPAPDETTVSSSGNAPASTSAGSPVTLSASVTVSGSSFNGIVDMEVYNSAGTRVFQQFYENESFSAGAERTFTATWTPESEGTYRLAIGVFRPQWSETMHWNHEAATINVSTGTTPPDNGGGQDGGEEQPPQTGRVEVWWPTDGASVSGTQPFKGILQGRSLEQYDMYWQVDGDRLNPMYDSQEGYPHKETLADLSGWHWKDSSVYTITLVAKEGDTVLGSQSVDITVH